MQELINNIINFLNNDMVIMIIYIMFFTIAINLFFLFYTIITIYNDNLFNNIRFAHGLIQPAEEDEIEERIHFHNTDTYDKYFLTGNNVVNKVENVTNILWHDKKFLIIPNKKIIRVQNKSGNKKIYLNRPKGSTEIKYKLKTKKTDWIKKKLTKNQMEEYSGTFIIGNLFIKYNNVSLIEMDCTGARKNLIRVFFEDGSEQNFDFSYDIFNEDIFLPHNIGFLTNCDIIEIV